MLKKAVQQGRSERRAEAYPLGYVEGLSEARTPLADFFSILLGREDVEHAILRGQIRKKLTEDARGTRYRIEGLARDGRVIHVMTRFKEDGALIIITVYAVTEEA